jgi:hypothetical protein
MIVVPMGSVGISVSASAFVVVASARRFSRGGRGEPATWALPDDHGALPAGGPAQRRRAHVGVLRGHACVFSETHLPNAFDLFAFVPYVFLKVVRFAFCSARQARAALIVACC